LRGGKNVQEKKIFVKEMYIFLMTLNSFLNEETFKVSLIFTKKKFFKINLLKSPIRHKKFFNQVFSEIFFVKLNIMYKTVSCVDYTKLTEMFFLFSSKLNIIGTNLLTKTKTTICFLNVFALTDDFEDDFEDTKDLIIENSYSKNQIALFNKIV